MANERVKDELQLLKRALSATQNGVIITDATRPDDPIVFVNRAFERITGYASEEVLGRNPRFLQAGDDDQPALDDLRKIREAHDDIEWTGVLRNYRKDGALFYNELSAAAVRDEEGRATHHIGVMSDVTERERAEGRLRFQAQLLNAVGQAVVATDLRGRIIHWNRAAEDLYGWSVEEVVGRPAHDLMVSEEQMERAGEVWSELSAGRSWSGEFVMRRRDGSSFPALVNDTPVFDERGGLVGIIGVSSDITERKEAEEALRKSERRFGQLFEHSVDALLVIHPETREVVDCNAEACRSLGYSREELLGLRLEDFASEVLSEEEKGRRGSNTPWRRALAGEPGTIIGFHENVHRRKDGTTFPVEVGVSSIKYGGRRMILASARDATERKRFEEALRQSEERYRRLVESSPEAIVVHDGRKVLYANPAAAQLFGAEAPEELLGRELFGFVHPDDRGTVASRVRAVLEGGKGTPLLEERYFRLDGGVVEAEVAGEPITYAGKPAVQAVLRDVTGRKRMEEELRHRATHDPLTGLPNRRLLLERLSHALGRRGREVALLFLDLDGFKVVNDSLGHEAGDRLLVAAAGRIGRAVRPSDTVARLGGDEFVVLLEDADREGATRAAERILAALESPFAVDDHELHTSASIGIALGGRDHDAGPDDLLREADLAMYRAKEGGKGRHKVYDPTMDARARERLELRSGLLHALKRREFALRYQPVVSLENGSVVGLEALLRWKHPDRGILPPAEFLAEAEDAGLAGPLFGLALGEACRLAAGLARGGDAPGDPSPWVSVNLSPLRLSDPDLVGKVAGALSATGIPPGRLVLEITEDAAVEGGGEAEATLGRIKGLGARLAIDDFGAGHSSLSQLERLPADFLKLDRAFGAGLEGGGRKTAVIRSMVDLAHALGLAVIAEGVETEAQLEILREAGCDLAQGHLFAEPLVAEEAVSLIAQGH